MKQLARDPLRVTDHAVLRYLERVQGQPIEEVREHIRKLCEGPHALGARCVRAEGHRFEINSNRVATVTSGHTLPSKTSRAISQAKVQR